MNRRIYTCLIVFLTSFTACNKDFLSHDNPTATTDDKWWKVESDLNNALADLYTGLPSGTLSNYDFMSNCRLHLSGATDESVFRADFGDWQTYGSNSNTAQSWSTQEMYQKEYYYIRNTCRFLEHYQTAYSSQPEKKERMAAEVRALRAWYHLDLFMLYGPIAIIDHSLSANEQYVKRNTSEEVVQFISSELEKAAAGLPDKYNLSEQYRITKGACYAMQTILYTQVNDYANAAITAKKVIDGNAYRLHTSPDPNVTNYAHLFSNNGIGNTEAILFKSRGQNAGFFRSAPRSLNGQACNSPTAALVNAYETLQGKTIQELGPDSFAIYAANPEYKNNRDPRLKATVIVPGETFCGKTLNPWDNNSADVIGGTQSTTSGYWVKKYVDPIDQGLYDGGQMNFMIIRYAEILLDYVEALIETGRHNDPDVTTYLNAIRQRAGMPVVDVSIYNTPEKLRTLVRRERQVELAFEGQRLFDIRRWKLAEKVMKGPVEGAVNPATGKPVVVEVRAFNPARDYLWAIPLVELTSNPNMVQNPGY
ncbi:RagB/SusD family nutrient uptake outer membrane protein [Chitinophaga sp.]|uniref:RagB/SusD family nutrient uptake outer membrane protein n=1 Tax=Chitinophaga sp. TaxID=1869181 RepID=UPI002F92D7CB